MKRTQIQLEQNVYELLRRRAFQEKKVDCRSDPGDYQERDYPNRSLPIFID